MMAFLYQRSLIMGAGAMHGGRADELRANDSDGGCRGRTVLREHLCAPQDRLRPRFSRRAKRERRGGQTRGTLEWFNLLPNQRAGEVLGPWRRLALRASRAGSTW